MGDKITAIFDASIDQRGWVVNRQLFRNPVREGLPTIHPEPTGLTEKRSSAKTAMPPRYSTRWPGFGLYPNVNNFSSGAPRATTLATYSPIAGPFLKPCPEPPPTIHTFSISG